MENESEQKAEKTNQEEQAVNQNAKKEFKKPPTTKTIKKNIYQKLMAIQATIKIPNNLNVDEVLKIVKPYLAEQECVLIMEDVIETFGGQIVESTLDDGKPIKKTVPITYVKVVARFIDCESSKEIVTTAYVKENVHKKTDASQFINTAISCAREQCLKGLFLLDDTEDSLEVENTKNKVLDTPKQANDKPQKFAGRTTQPVTQDKQEPTSQDKPKATFGWGKK